MRNPNDASQFAAVLRGSDSGSILTAAEFISRERLCCPFFDMELAVSGADGPTWLRITGGEGVKDFLSGLRLVQSAPTIQSR
jgi:hypothetical protein